MKVEEGWGKLLFYCAWGWGEEGDTSVVKSSIDIAYKVIQKDDMVY